MPERRNVLRKVISPAVAEVAVEIRTEMPEVHYLKVQGLLEEGRKEVPILRLKGKWMREYNSLAGSHRQIKMQYRWQVITLPTSVLHRHSN